MPVFHTLPINIEAFRFRVDKSPEWFAAAIGRGDVRLGHLGCEIRTTIGWKFCNNGDYIVEGPDGSLGCHNPETFSVFFRPGEFKEDINKQAVSVYAIHDAETGEDRSDRIPVD